MPGPKARLTQSSCLSLAAWPPNSHSYLSYTRVARYASKGRGLGGEELRLVSKQFRCQEGYRCLSRCCRPAGFLWTERPKEPLGLVIPCHCRPLWGLAGYLVASPFSFLPKKVGHSVPCPSWAQKHVAGVQQVDGLFSRAVGVLGVSPPAVGSLLQAPRWVPAGPGRGCSEQSSWWSCVCSLLPPFLKLSSAAKHFNSDLNQGRHRCPQPPSSLCGFFLICGALD